MLYRDVLSLRRLGTAYCKGHSGGGLRMEAVLGTPVVTRVTTWLPLIYAVHCLGLSTDTTDMHDFS